MEMDKIPEDDLLSTHELANLLGLSPSTLQGWRQHHKGPKALRISYRVVRYRRSDVEAWLSEAHPK